MWSTLCVKSGNPSIISEWLVRSQQVPLTVIAELSDAYEHPPCRYKDSATATLADNSNLEVCPRHEAVLSLDQLLPHRSRIHDLDILVHSSDPEREEGDHGGERPLLYHHFFKKSLPNLQRLDFRATHIEQSRNVIPTPELLFEGRLPRLKEPKYLGANGGLIGTVRDLASCEIGVWSGSAGPAMTGSEGLPILLRHNRTVKSLIIRGCEFFLDGDPWMPIVIPMTNLKHLEIHCDMDFDFETIVTSIRAPQSKNLDTVQVSLPDSSIRRVATDGAGHTFEFSQRINTERDFHPLRYLRAEITTLRLDEEMTLEQLDEGPALYDFFRSLDTVQVLEFDGAIASVENVLSNVLPIAGVFPGLKVIRVAINLDDCKGALQLFAAALKLRMEEGNPLTTVEPFSAEGEDELSFARSGRSITKQRVYRTSCPNNSVPYSNIIVSLCALSCPQAVSCPTSILWTRIYDG